MRATRGICYVCRVCISAESIVVRWEEVELRPSGNAGFIIGFVAAFFVTFTSDQGNNFVCTYLCG
jgi:hypothetical protein